MKKQEVNKILSDDVLIFAHRKRLWRNGITPNYKLSDEVVEFLLFLESHNHLLDFIMLFKKHSTVLDYDKDGVPFYRKNTSTLKEYFNGMPQRFYLRGVFNCYKEYENVWNGLEELWSKQIKK